MQELVTFLARGLVAHPDDIRVHTLEGNTALIIELTVNEADVPRIIGQSGRNIRAIRQVLSAASGRRKAVLELVNTHAGSEEEE